MRGVFGVISIVIQNLRIAQEDIECNKKVENFTFDTLRLDVKIFSHCCNDGRKVTLRGPHLDNNLDYVSRSSTINKFGNSQKSVFLLNLRL